MHINRACSVQNDLQTETPEGNLVYIYKGHICCGYFTSGQQEKKKWIFAPVGADFVSDLLQIFVHKFYSAAPSAETLQQICSCERTLRYLREFKNCIIKEKYL